MKIGQTEGSEVKRRVREFYDAQKYSPQWETKAGRHYKQEKLASYLKYMAMGDAILDAGCADFNYTLYFAELGYKISGMDISSSQLDAGRARARENGLDIPAVVGDVESLPYDDKNFDTVISMSTLLFVPAPEKAISELARVARKSIIIDVPNKRCPYYSIMAKFFRKGFLGFRVEGRQFDEAEIRKMFEPTGFDVIEVEYKLLVYRAFPDWLFYILRVVEKMMIYLPLRKLLGVMIVYAKRRNPASAEAV